MLKRTIISLLAVLLMVAATTSVFAFDFPTNNVAVSSTIALEIDYSISSVNYTDSIASMSLVNSGESSKLCLSFISDGNRITSFTNWNIEYFHVTFTISVPCDIYILSPVNSVEADATKGSLGAAGLLSHWDSSATIYYDSSVNGQLPANCFLVDVVKNTYTTTSIPASTIPSINGYYLKFNDVPVGSYTYYIPSSSFTRTTLNSSVGLTMTAIIPFGFYLAETTPPSGGGDTGGGDTGGGDTSGGDTSGGGIDQTYLDSWIDPTATFQQNIISIQNTLNEAVAGSDDADVQTFYALYANYQLDLLQKDNDLSFTNTVNNVETSFSHVINDYISGNITYADALDDLSDSYVNSLADCSTPEQGSFLTAVYQAKQTQLHYKAVDLAGEVIKDVITDEELDNAEDYYEAEEALISQFQLQNLQDTVKFQEWYNLLGSAEALTYKSIFDWFLNSSSFKYWLIIPLSMIVITNLLGTVLYVSRHRAYNSRFSDRGNKND